MYFTNIVYVSNLMSMGILPEGMIIFYYLSDIRSEGSIAIIKEFDFDFLLFLILHQSKNVCVFVCPLPIIEPKLIDRSRSNSISRVLL